MKSILFAAIALVGFSAAAPPAYHQYPRHYPAHDARDAYPAAYTVLPYYNKVKEYVPRSEPTVYSYLNKVSDNLPRSYKPLPKYKQYKKAPAYGSRKKRQDLPATPEVPSLDNDNVLPSVPSLPAVGKRQDVPSLPDTNELPTSTLPEVGGIA